jgi:hypothetical protein
MGGAGVAAGTGATGGAAGMRPFVLQTPHHTDAWQGGYGGGGDRPEEQAAAYEYAMRQLDSRIDAGEFELSQLRERYEELEAEYERLRGGMDGGGEGGEDEDGSEGE